MDDLQERLDLFGDPSCAAQSARSTLDRVSGTFSSNTKLPVHRWFRYSAGFSADWVRSVLEGNQWAENILDPFVGSGTVLIEAEKLGRKAVGIEAHPLVSRIATAKLAWRGDVHALRDMANEIASSAEQLAPKISVEESKLLDRCFTLGARKELAALKSALDTNVPRADTTWMLCWLAFLSIIRESSHVGTAQWQYLLPNRRKTKTVTPIAGFRARIDAFTRDMLAMKPYLRNP